MIDLSKEEVRSTVRDHYGLIAREGGSCCSPSGGSACCGSPTAKDHKRAS